MVEGAGGVLIAQHVVHHFDDATNRQLKKRIARAQRPGGFVAILEPLGQDRTGKVRQSS